MKSLQPSTLHGSAALQALVVRLCWEPQDVTGWSHVVTICHETIWNLGLHMPETSAPGKNASRACTLHETTWNNEVFLWNLKSWLFAILWVHCCTMMVARFGSVLTVDAETSTSSTSSTKPQQNLKLLKLESRFQCFQSWQVYDSDLMWFDSVSRDIQGLCHYLMGKRPWISWSLWSPTALIPFHECCGTSKTSCVQQRTTKCPAKVTSICHLRISQIHDYMDAASRMACGMQLLDKRCTLRRSDRVPVTHWHLTNLRLFGSQGDGDRDHGDWHRWHRWRWWRCHQSPAPVIQRVMRHRQAPRSLNEAQLDAISTFPQRNVYTVHIIKYIYILYNII